MKIPPRMPSKSQNPTKGDGEMYTVEILLNKKVENEQVGRKFTNLIFNSLKFVYISTQLSYLVKWVGYPEEDATWEPVKELPDSVIAEYESVLLIKTENENKYTEIIKVMRRADGEFDCEYLKFLDFN